MVIAREPRIKRMNLTAAGKGPKKPADLAMRLKEPKRPWPKAGVPLPELREKTIGKAAGQKVPFAPEKEMAQRAPRAPLFTIGGREFKPRSVPHGLNPWQAGRLMAHKETFGEVGGGLEALIRAASRPQLKAPLKKAA